MKPPVPPKIDQGVRGLAAVLKYALELKYYEEAVQSTDPNHKPEKLTGIAAQINEIFKMKMAEAQELHELIQTTKLQNRELLENLLQEQNFKVLLRSVLPTKDENVEQLLEAEMKTVKKMFSSMSKQMTSMQGKIEKIRENQHV